MCLILFAFGASERWPLVVAANRDESYLRPSSAAAFWHDHGDICGGRDLEKGGTWMGLTRGGRFAAITNFRDGYPKGVAPRSRGELAGTFLAGREAPGTYLRRIAAHAGEFAGFSMLAGDLNEMWCYSNHGGRALALPPGVHGLSNHLINTPWPKVTDGKRELQNIVESTVADPAPALFDMLAGRHVAPEHALPNTGVGIAREKQLGPKFIAVDDRYGTRASTVILIDAQYNVHYTERSFGGRGKFLSEVTQQFQITRSSP